VVAPRVSFRALVEGAEAGFLATSPLPASHPRELGMTCGAAAQRRSV